MNYQIGSQIKKLREERKITQDQMAEKLNTTRQRFARMENGQIDLSYVVIKEIADILEVPVKEITSVLETKKGLVAMFREKSDRPEVVEALTKVEEILKVFRAHQRLYFQMRKQDEQ